MTGNFGTKALIGEGSYGRVFYAKLKDGMPAAIKKLDTSSSQEPDSDFEAQVRYRESFFLVKYNVLVTKSWFSVCIWGHAVVCRFKT